jgi:hypothetical protein
MGVVNIKKNNYLSKNLKQMWDFYLKGGGGE